MNMNSGSGHEREFGRTPFRTVLVALVTATLTPTALRAQEPSLTDVLHRTATYVQRFQQQIAGIAAQETYVQAIRNQSSALGVSPFRAVRTLKSDLLLLRPAGADRYVEYRDVFEVDGQAVRDREERLTALLQDRSASGMAQVGRIVSESARYNIGRVVRTVNTPLLTLLFLDPAFQPRVRFTRENTRAAPVDTGSGAAAGHGNPMVFRVSTEMWTIAFRERDRPTIIKRPGGGNLAARGRFWINPDTGAVLMSELVTEGGDVAAIITVSYQSEPLMGCLVPVEMRERYVGFREHIDGHAVYGRFRLLDQR